MKIQSWIEGIDGLASLYAFDILEDGSYSEIRLMAVNGKNELMLHMTPDTPPFYPGIPYRNYWMDLNFESFVYKCATTSEPLYSYVNARGIWLKGLYIPIADIWEETPVPEIPAGAKRVFCLYVVTFNEKVETESLPRRSTEVSNAILDIGMKLHDTKDYYQTLAEVTVMIKGFCDAELCALYIVDKERRECSFINQNGLQDSFWKGFTAEMGRTPYEVAEAWEQDLALSDCLILDDLLWLEERDPVWYTSMCSHGMQNLVLFAIRYDQTIVGYICAANYDVGKRDQIKEMLELSTFMIAAVIRNHQLLSKLEEKSAVDALTQVGNRNAMDGCIDGYAKGLMKLPETMGVVFADLNGLKRVNDEEGHDAGDSLLIRAAALLRIVFGNQMIFRAGGDEFVILCPDIPEEKVTERIAQLKDMAEATSDVSFAVGSAFCKGEYDINAAIQTADERMYQDKKEYYSKHADRDRRRG